MLSVKQAADRLGVSTARVRALIRSESLPASKLGREWMIREEDVLARMMSKPRSGRPKERAQRTSGIISLENPIDEEARSLYYGCKRAFSRCPSAALIQQACSQEEESFYMAVADFFLQSRQDELISDGVF